MSWTADGVIWALATLTVVGVMEKQVRDKATAVARTRCLLPVVIIFCGCLGVPEGGRSGEGMKED